MMVTFVSECEKKALNRTRRVLDAFANRIGDNTWQTVITEEGLVAVKTLLRKTATKNTAVSCHWIRSRSRSELVWIVGNRRRFNALGMVPVNTTQKNLLNQHWENHWSYLPAIKALVAVAALLHDWGKATALFQDKLKSGTAKGDPLRHEWISCLLLRALVLQAGDNDETWLQSLSNGDWDETAIQRNIAENAGKLLANLPPIAQLIGWLILSHHRLPFLANPVSEQVSDREQKRYKKRETLDHVLRNLNATWGYQNKFDEQDFQQRLAACFGFPEGLLAQSAPWQKQLKKWATRLLQAREQIQALLENGAYRVLLHHARLSLMLGDHYYSSCNADPDWDGKTFLIANTDRSRNPKQKLDEHLVRVSGYGLKISQSLARFSDEMEVAYDIRSLKQKSPPAYAWQDKAVDAISRFKTQHQNYQAQGYGWFVVNMASTGCGKTIANAKIMRALSGDGDSLRYVLALGLRTLTLQTGNEYRKRIGLGEDELAVLIGSAAVQALYDQAKRNKEAKPDFDDIGSESLELLLAEDLDYQEMPGADFLDVLFPKRSAKLAEKYKAFLYKPVLACTLDHVIAATETRRGGKYILPCLRLLSSDLVIDEVDDFDGADLVAIGRLIHLAGMLGRKVMISSATIAPHLAEGFFNAYQEGWRLHSLFKQAHPMVACAWVDEFGTRVERLDNSESMQRCQHYQMLHREFIAARVGKLQKQTVKRKAVILRCDDLLADKPEQESLRQAYFDKIKQATKRLHAHHHTVDVKTGKRVSFGVIRMANIPPCIALTRYLLQAEWDDKIAPRIMAYHSQQVLLLRHQQEMHMDSVLQRKEKLDETPAAFQDTLIRSHLDHCEADDVMFIVVATPVEEVGRDHDFDWAVIEPSSFRSIIQLAGRVLRHRSLAADIEQPNIAILQYNLKALRNEQGPAYCRPGYENAKSLRLESHDMCELVDEPSLNRVVNAIPRIQQAESLQPSRRLADLEHQALNKVLTDYPQKGPQALQAWLAECWWLTAVPQQLNRFRASSPDRTLYLRWQDSEAVFCEKDQDGQFIPYQDRANIQRTEALDTDMQARLWLDRNYQGLLKQRAEAKEDVVGFDLEKLLQADSERFGEINQRLNSERPWFYSDQLGLFQEPT